MHFDVLNGRMMVADDAKDVPDSDIAAAVKRTGMAASRWQPGQQDGDQDRHRQKQIALTTLSGLCLLAAALPHFWQGTGVPETALRVGSHEVTGRSWVEVLGYTAAIAFGVRYVLPKAWFAVRRLRPDINLLMVIAIAGAIGIGEWFEAATVAFLFSLSLTLESWSVGRARRAISGLLDLAPATVHVLSASGEEREIAAAEVFFGFTYCPDVCPTTLNDVAVVLEELGSDADQVQPLFVTVDPERDTPEVMAEYLANFDPRIVGLTGTPEQIEQAAQAFRVYHSKAEQEGAPDGYTMDHSAFLYLMDPQGDYATHFSVSDEPAAIAEEIRVYLEGEKTVA